MNVLIWQDNGVAFFRQKAGSWGHFLLERREEGGKTILKFKGPERTFDVHVSSPSVGEMHFMPLGATGSPLLYRKSDNAEQLYADLEEQVRNSPEEAPTDSTDR